MEQTPAFLSVAASRQVPPVIAVQLIMMAIDHLTCNGAGDFLSFGAVALTMEFSADDLHAMIRAISKDDLECTGVYAHLEYVKDDLVLLKAQQRPLPCKPADSIQAIECIARHFRDSHFIEPERGFRLLMTVIDAGMTVQDFIQIYENLIGKLDYGWEGDNLTGLILDLLSDVVVTRQYECSDDLLKWLKGTTIGGLITQSLLRRHPSS